MNRYDMANIDKQSVRDEFDKIKSGFDEHVKAGKVSTEVGMLFNTLIMLFSLVLSIFLEKSTKKTSANSSIPPSQTDKDETTPPNTGPNGKGINQTTTTVENTRTVEIITTIAVDSCLKCGEDLSHVPCACIERRTRIDIVFEKTVEHVDVEIKECPSCKSKTKGPFPDYMAGPLQYGNGIKAFIVQLLVTQMISLNRAVKLVATLIGRTISEATMLGYIMRLYGVLETWEINARLKLLASPCMHSDETSCRVDKKNYWIHVYSAGDITLKCLHRKRGKEAIEFINIIPQYGGVIVHDCWISYFSYNGQHALCGSHLLRELTFIVDAHWYHWAKRMKCLLKAACKSVTKSKDKCLDEKGYLKLVLCYKVILARGEKELPTIPVKPNGRRGKIAK